MLLRNMLRTTKSLHKITRAYFSDTSVSNAGNDSSLQSRFTTFQFTKEKCTDFGDLPRGEVPDALKVDPKFDHVKLDNGVQIGMEHFDGHHSGNVFPW